MKTSWRAGCWSRSTRAVLDVWRTGAAGRCPWWWTSRSRGYAGVAPTSKDSAAEEHVGAVWNKNRGEDTVVQSRAASQEDSEAIARIYNEGIEERIATFETSPREAREIRAWFDGTHPVVVVEDEGEVISFANTPSRKLLSYLGFREVGIHEKHARLDGVWRDVVVVERLLPANL